MKKFLLGCTMVAAMFMASVAVAAGDAKKEVKTECCCTDCKCTDCKCATECKDCSKDGKCTAECKGCACEGKEACTEACAREAKPCSKDGQVCDKPCAKEKGKCHKGEAPEGKSGKCHKGGGRK